MDILRLLIHRAILAILPMAISIPTLLESFHFLAFSPTRILPGFDTVAVVSYYCVYPMKYNLNEYKNK